MTVADSAFPGEPDLPGNDFEWRKTWARRQGNPAWLWPEIDPCEWRGALIQIGQTLGAVLNGKDPRPLTGAPDAIGLAGYTSGMGPMLGWWIEQGILPEPEPAISKRLASHLEHNRQRMAQLLGRGAELTEALARHGIEASILKGAHTALAYFPEPGTRPMSDLDMLVEAKAVAAADDVLRSAGYVRQSRGRLEDNWRMAGTATDPRTLLFLHADDPWSIDLHHSLDLRVASGSAPVRLQDAVTFAGHWPGGHARVLAQPVLLLHLAIHAGAGLQNLTLLRLLELILVIRKDVTSGRLLWNEFLDVARRSDCLGFAYPALALCRQLAEDVVPQAVLDECAAAVPRRALRVIEGLAPATAHRVDRCSIREHFMWTRGLGGWVRQLAADLFPPTQSLAGVLSIYSTRGWRLLRGGFSR